MITVITTCNAEGWKLYGSNMVTSLRRYWPKDTRLVFYVEGFAARTLDVYELPQWHTAFKARHADNPIAHGMGGGEYNFRRDCVRFSHKVAALTDPDCKVTEGLLIWADADTLTRKEVDEDWLQRFVPHNHWIGWLDRSPKYPECGFMIFRANHSGHQIVLDRLREIYETDRVFELPQTHDSYVIQQVVGQAVKDGTVPPPISLSGPLRSNHPFATGPLGSRMDHLKGSRKMKGRSR